MVESKLDIAMVYIPCVYEDESLNHIYDYTPERIDMEDEEFEMEFTLPQKRHK